MKQLCEWLSYNYDRGVAAYLDRLKHFLERSANIGQFFLPCFFSEFQWIFSSAY
jgi:hypothetical protein